MAAYAARWSDLTDDDKASIFQSLDAILNSEILYSLLHGIYTGIVTITLWNIFINKRRLIQRSTVVMIVLLHALITFNFAVAWSYIHSAFIENGQSFRTVYSRLYGPAHAVFWETCVTATLGTILADLYMIWCCWMVWGQRWRFVLLPILSFISAIGDSIRSRLLSSYSQRSYSVVKFIEEYQAYFNTSYEVFLLLYISFILVTTLWCTSLIIYRILTVHLIEVLVESSALYSISLIVYLALAVHEDSWMYYLDTIAAVAKGVTPTLLVGRAVAGHTRPKDDCDESAVSTLRFQMPSELCTTNFRESTMQSAVLEIDTEAQPERILVFVEETQYCSR
ncbi:hypothetical protein F5146DRAFT_1224897 [Armillaria mellea]|nr:hypothetical protein F5146DRAFT_1224897 [Armillaria mellea]